MLWGHRGGLSDSHLMVSERWLLGQSSIHREGALWSRGQGTGAGAGPEVSLCSGLPLPSGLGSQAASHPLITDRDTKQFISCLREPAKNRPTGCNNFSGWRLVKLQTTSPRQLISLAGMRPGTGSVQVNCYWGTFKKIKESFPKTGRYL